MQALDTFRRLVSSAPSLRGVESSASTELDSRFACGTTLVDTFVGETYHATEYEYCIQSIDQPAPGEYVLNMDCDWSIESGNGVGDMTITISVITGGTTTKTIETKDCGFGFPDTIEVSEPDGGAITLLMTWDAFGGGSLQLDATLPDPSGVFDPGLVEAVGCNVDPREVEEDSSTALTGRVTISNDNAVSANATVEWLLNGSTSLKTQGNLTVPANSQDFFDISLPLPFDWPVDPGEHDVEAVVIDAEPA